MTHSLCLHGHFYQPVREDPWTGRVRAEPSAAPAHDWNERITAQCYTPNTCAKILDAQGAVAQRLNNFAWINFDIGPTLLSWLQHHAPNTYEAIIAADRESAERWRGHGNAIAQSYHHSILPLANARDQYTELFWGLRAFESHFGRRPEGLWLPETAVDLPSLDLAARLGLRFTVLAPHQAALVSALAKEDWYDVRGGIIDPTMAYAIDLPCKKPFACFFYDGPISRAVAFEALLRNGDAWLQRLLGGFNVQRAWPQLMHIATDGESYGHHHVFGEMALAYALDTVRQRGDVTLTNYAAFLAAHPPTHRVQIAERTSWSCAHGIERWRSDCGCVDGGSPGWKQAWRASLRTTLDWLRDAIAPQFERAAAVFLRDPWDARNDFINCLVGAEDTPGARRAQFFRHHAARALTQSEQTCALALLQLQQHALAMYTSCGWFFADPSGLETAIVVRHARRAAQLADRWCDTQLEAALRVHLETVHSNQSRTDPTAWLDAVWVLHDGESA